MIEFILRKRQNNYTLYCNNNMLVEKIFTRENDAICYFNAYISDWNNSHLTLSWSKK